MFDILVVGAGIAGTTFAFKTSKHAKVLLIDKRAQLDTIKGTKIFPEHNRPFINEVDWNDKKIFPRVHNIIRYFGTESECVLHANEFGKPYGNICYIENLLKWLMNSFEDNGGMIKFNETISKIIRHTDYIEVVNKKGESYSTKLLVLATGSHKYDLQTSLGFGAPSQYTGLYSHFYGDEDLINDNLPIEYNFHINSKISKKGPFFIAKGSERVFIGFLGNNPNEAELKSKFERICNNYKKVQPVIKDLEPDPSPTVVKISKHPIKDFSKDRVLVIGEAAGLVTSFFYEGLFGSLASAHLSSQTVLENMESDFNETILKTFDTELRRIVLNTYFKFDVASEYMFYNATKHIDLLYNTYAKLVASNTTVRKYIWEAHITHEMDKYDTTRERWAGEQLFKKLPTYYKLLLGPKFLITLFK